MKRAAILIGVNKTGNAPVLNDAVAGAKRMAEWAQKQRMPFELMTDEGGKPVEAHEIFAKVKQFGGVDQLVIYFAGHGINVGYAERWLLSNAPGDPNAAVNVKGSAEVAHYSGIGHVVLFSDACRTAAEGLQAQGVTGSIIFENRAAAGTVKPVDQFWATRLGDPSHEIKDPKHSAGLFTALYTDALLDAIRGENPEVVESDPPDSVVRPRPLKYFLHEELKRRIKARNLAGQVIQEPDALITSDPPAWLSRLPTAGLKGAGPVPGGGPAGPAIGFKNFVGVAPAGSLESVTRTLLRSAVAGGPMLAEALQRARADSKRTIKAIAESVDRTVKADGPDHFETACGFKVRGARVVEAFAKHAKLKQLDDALVKVEKVDPPGESVLITFEGGAGAVVPAIPEFIATLTIDDGQLTDVSYEPSSQTSRYQEFKKRAEQIRTLRGIAASATRSGVFRIEAEDSLRLASQMQYAKGFDPTLAVYAAYAYLDLRRRDRIKEMSRYMGGDLGTRLFDIAMLAGEIAGKLPGGNSVLPLVPLLAQGWSLLPAFGVKLPAALNRIEATLLPSVWSLFNAQGVKQLHAAISQG